MDDFIKLLFLFSVYENNVMYSVYKFELSTRENQVKRPNPSYRPYPKGNPSQLILRLSESGLPGIVLQYFACCLNVFVENEKRPYGFSVCVSKIRNIGLAISRSSRDFQERSKNNLRGISFRTRPIWGIQSLRLILSSSGS